MALETVCLSVGAMRGFLFENPEEYVK